MQAGKQYSSNGVQYAMYPNPIMNITQTINGYYSHRGTNAIDDAQADSGISNGYAPCDMVCVATDYGDAYGNAMFWQSTAPVITRSHGQQYITMMVIHDNTADAYVGLTVSQGQQLFSEGTAGNATGNHNHIEVALGQWTGTHYVASGGSTAWGTTVWMLPGNINPAEVFFVDDTQILDGGGLDWATTGGSSATASSGFSTDQLIEEHAKATFTVDGINARVNNPNSDFICRQYNTGDTVEYTHKWVGNGHRYICWWEATNLIMCAVSETEDYNSTRWATFSAIEDSSEKKEDTKEETKTDEVDTSNVKHWGIDISEHNNRDLDLSKYDFVIIRASYGENTDKKLDHFVKKAEQANIPYGLYHYSYAINDEESDAETKYFLDLVKNYNPTLGLWFDMEDADDYKKKNNVLDREHVLRFTQNFCKKVKSEGYYVGIYSSTWWFENWLNEGLDDYDKWVANWGTNDGDYHSDTSTLGTIHQYTSIDKETGTNIDKNAMYVDFSNYKVEKSDSDEKKDDTVNKDTSSDTKDTTDDTIKETNSLLKMLIELIKKIFNVK